MSNSKEQVKIPTKEGLAEARKKLKEMRRKEPSPELVKIIADIAEQQDTQPKAPTKAGLDRARKRLKELRRQEPSPELVKIIEEVTREPDARGRCGKTL